jgi:branched-chain amino acid transport system substrate-binding protein
MNRKWKSIIVGMLAICMLTTIAGCSSTKTSSSSASNTSPIRLGLDCPMTGTNASFGVQLNTGAQMAVKEINDAGGINGRKIEVDVQDDKSDPKEAANIAIKWCADKTIVGTFGYYNSSCCLAALPILNQNHLPSIFSGSSPDISNQNKTYGFRIEPSDSQQATLAGNWMIKDGCKKVAILYESTDYGMGQRDIITNVIKNGGGQVVVSEAYIEGETKDFTDILTKVKNSDADSIFIAGVYTEGALIAKQMKGLGMNLPIYSSSSMFEQAFLDLAGDAANGTKVLGVLLPNDPSPVVSKFETKYKAMFGADKIGGTFTSYGYDDIRMFAAAIQAVGTDPDAIVGYFEKMSFPGVSGILKFDKNHDIVRDKLTQLIVVNDKFQIYNGNQ